MGEFVAGDYAAVKAMFKVVRLQFCVLLAVTAVAAVLAGRHAASSAALGAAVYWFPNLLFAWRLNVAPPRRGAAESGPSGRPQSPGPMVFLLGEILKLVVTLGLMVAVAVSGVGVHWVWFLLGLAAVLQSNFFAFLIRT